jgi:hypothetical protein
MSWTEYNNLRVNGVKENVSMTDVLHLFGITVHTVDREFQYPCPLHGDGRDSSFSARYYPDSESTYCFACHKSRDVVEWVRDAKGLSFSKALAFLEQSFDLAPIPLPAFLKEKENTFASEIADLFEDSNDGISLLDRIHSLDKTIRRKIKSGADMSKVIKAFFLLDVLDHDLRRGSIEEEKAMRVFTKIQSAVREWDV